MPSGLLGITFKLYNVNQFDLKSLSLFSDISYRINCLQAGQCGTELSRKL